MVGFAEEDEATGGESSSPERGSSTEFISRADSVEPPEQGDYDGTQAAYSRSCLFQFVVRIFRTFFVRISFCSELLVCCEASAK